ncbi:MAG: hypothetical protein Q9P90_04370 [candidate division KSB1 bacterium]|nr:hypothetical protein [candidate division KSB1 bacterium]
MRAVLLPMKLVLMSAMIVGASFPALSQPRTYQMFAAVLSNKSYVVGGENPGAGLFVSRVDAPGWQSRSFSNLRMFNLEILPEEGEGLYYTANGNGVIVSRDSGRHWRVTTGWQITEVLKIAAVPENPAVVYIGTAYGAYRSSDFGETWQPISQRFVYALQIDQQHRHRLYIGEEDGLRIGTDGGDHLMRAKGIAAPVLSIAQHPGQPDILFAGTEDAGLFMSHDRGLSWQPIESGDAAGATVYDILFSPHNPDSLLAATFAHGVLISADGGRTWRPYRSGLERMPVSCLAAHPGQPGTYFAGTLNYGVFCSRDGGRIWQPFGLNGAQIMELEIHAMTR